METTIETNIKDIIDQVNEAFKVGSTDGFLDHCTEDVRWTMIGQPALEGKEAIRAFMGGDEPCGPIDLTVTDTLVEGSRGVAYGEMSMPNKEGILSKYAYCDTYRFDGEKITELNSYIVERKNEGATTTVA